MVQKSKYEVALISANPRSTGREGRGVGGHYEELRKARRFVDFGRSGGTARVVSDLRSLVALRVCRHRRVLRCVFDRNSSHSKVTRTPSVHWTRGLRHWEAYHE